MSVWRTTRRICLRGLPGSLSAWSAADFAERVGHPSAHAEVTPPLLARRAESVGAGPGLDAPHRPRRGQGSPGAPVVGLIRTRPVCQRATAWAWSADDVAQRRWRQQHLTSDIAKLRFPLKVPNFSVRAKQMACVSPSRSWIAAPSRHGFLRTLQPLASHTFLSPHRGRAMHQVNGFFQGREVTALRRTSDPIRLMRFAARNSLPGPQPNRYPSPC